MLHSELAGVVEGWGLGSPNGSLTCLVVDGGSQLGPLGLLAETLTRGLSVA